MIYFSATHFIRSIIEFLREGREAIDLVHDDVEKNLLKERETIRSVMALLQRTLDQTTEQIRVMRSRRYTLEKDLTDKFSALDIDQDCRELRDDNPHLTYKSGAAKIETKYGASLILYHKFQNGFLRTTV